MSDEPLFERLALIGVGLIGSSIARAARARGAARSIVASARSAATRRRVAELELADVADTNAAAVKDADLVIVCVPVGQCGAVAAEIGPHLKAGAIVSDVGSVKAQVARDMAPHLPAGVHFVPAHPVAGTEYSGPDAGFAELFVNRWCILTPPEHADPAAVERLSAFWQALGSNVETMSAEHHDLVLAITSHVPHLIAYTIVGTADDLEAVTRSEVMKFSAGGFRDFTRIAASDPTMWRDVFSPIETPCWRCWEGSTRTSPPWRGRSAGPTATLCSIYSRARARSGAASSNSARIPGRRISAAPMRRCRLRPCRGHTRPTANRGR